MRLRRDPAPHTDYNGGKDSGERVCSPDLTAFALEALYDAATLSPPPSQLHEHQTHLLPDPHCSFNDDQPSGDEVGEILECGRVPWSFQAARRVCVDNDDVRVADEDPVVTPPTSQLQGADAAHQFCHRGRRLRSSQSKCTALSLQPET